jgi:CRISPR-associated protein Cas2
MRRDYLVTYDVCDDKRLRKVFKAMKGFGEHIQYSVFRCALNDTELIQLRERLSGLINQLQDQVLVVDLGGLPEKRPRISPIGRPYSAPDPGARVF